MQVLLQPFPVSGYWYRGATRCCCVQKRLVARDAYHIHTYMRSELTPPNTLLPHCVASPLNDSNTICLVIIPSTACGTCVWILKLLSLLYSPRTLSVCGPASEYFRMYCPAKQQATITPPPSYWSSRRETPMAYRDERAAINSQVRERALFCT